MRSTILRLSAASLAVAALAGCGSTAGEQVQAPKNLPLPAAAPTGAGVGVTAGRVGDATSATDGVEKLLDRGGEVRPGAGVPPAGVREGVDGAADCGAVDTEPTQANLGEVGASVLCLLNVERTSRGLPGLTRNPQLDQAASVQSADMVAKQYFGHQSPSGSAPVDRIRATGYIPTDRSWTVGENLAWGSGVLATPAAIVRAWMASPGHRDNILKPAYKEIGLSVVFGVPKAGIDGGATFATTFGGLEDVAAAPAPAAPAPAATGSQVVAQPVAAKAPKASTKKKAKKAKKKVKKVAKKTRKVRAASKKARR